MITFGAWRWNDAKGGMRFAFPPYGLRATGYGLRELQEMLKEEGEGE
jgi:hypothetical protein